MNITKEIHIITFDIPYPVNYGGVIDVFYKIKALKEAGIKIHLHCFYHKRKKNKILNTYCESVKYYKRKITLINFFSSKPFIVKSRDDKNLIKNLAKKKCPIIFEGIHSTKLINNKKILYYKKFVRTYNIETDYYRLLAKVEKNIFKKIYLFSEYLKIYFYQKKIKHADGIFAIKKNDQKYFQKYSKSYHIKAFHSNSNVTSKKGKGNFSLYHGNLSIAENENAALFLIRKIFAKNNYKLIVAGNNPKPRLEKEISKHENIKLIKNPKNKELSSIISNAHINLLKTNQNTGIKLKLIESLYRGRFCIGNNKMLVDSEVEKFCFSANSTKEWMTRIEKIKNQVFDENKITKRKKIEKIFNNKKEAEKIKNIIYND